MKCIIVDDEPFAIELLRSYVEKTESLELVGTFSNPVKAHSFLMKNSVDLIFLDIKNCNTFHRRECCQHKKWQQSSQGRDLFDSIC